MKDFDAALDEALNSRMTTRLRVVQLGGQSRRIGGQEWQWFCLCVTAEGCPCKSPFLIPIRDILDRFVIGEKTEEGDEIIEIVIPKDTDVLVQNVARSSVARLVVTRGEGCGCDGADAIPDTLQSLPWKAIVDAFRLGWNIGKAIDEGSDGAVSDYLADKIEDAVDAIKDLVD